MLTGLHHQEKLQNLPKDPAETTNVCSSISGKGFCRGKSTAAARAVTSQPEYVDLVSQKQWFSGTERAC